MDGEKRVTGVTRTVEYVNKAGERVDPHLATCIDAKCWGCSGLGFWRQRPGLQSFRPQNSGEKDLVAAVERFKGYVRERKVKEKTSDPARFRDYEEALTDHIRASMRATAAQYRAGLTRRGIKASKGNIRPAEIAPMIARSMIRGMIRGSL